jgi:hypothetical protein
MRSGIRWLAAAWLASSACAPAIWYKTGASAGDLTRDKSECRESVAAIPDAQAQQLGFESCMRDRDWYYTNYQKPKATKVVVRRTPRDVASDAPRPPLASAAVPADVPSVPVPLPVVLGAAQTGMAAPVPLREAAVPVLDALAEEEVVLETVDEPAAPTEPARNRSLWWRLGGSMERLGPDQQSCLQASGRVKAESERILWGESDAFDACMRERGWHGGGH